MASKARTYGLAAQNLRPPHPESQATRQGWPYYIRPLHQRHDRIV